jgi:hypothetical protein
MRLFVQNLVFVSLPVWSVDTNSKPSDAFPELRELFQEVLFPFAMFSHDRGWCTRDKTLVAKLFPDRFKFRSEFRDFFRQPLFFRAEVHYSL